MLGHPLIFFVGFSAATLDCWQELQWSNEMPKFFFFFPPLILTADALELLLSLHLYNWFKANDLRIKWFIEILVSSYSNLLRSPLDFIFITDMLNIPLSLVYSVLTFFEYCFNYCEFTWLLLWSSHFFFICLVNVSKKERKTG